MAGKPKYRLTNIEVEEISLVDRPANKRRILVKKAEDPAGGDDAEAANQVGAEAVEENVDAAGGEASGEGHDVAAAPADIEKAMPEELSAARLAELTPRDDMTDEELREQLAARSREFGIEALDSAPLRFQADRPRDLKEYGDPANLGYPADTEARARNALARGQQNIPSAYSQERSRAIVWERIVRAAMEYGIEHPFDPDDELDALLPADLRGELEEMMAAAATKKKMTALFAAAVQAAEAGAAAAAAARVDKLERALVAERRRSAALEKRLATEPTRPAALIKEHARAAGKFSWGTDLTLELDR